MKILGHIRRHRPREAWGLAQIAGSDRLVRVRIGPQGIVARPAVSADSEQTREAEQQPVRRVAGGGIIYPLQDLSLQHERLNLPTINPDLIDSAVRHQLAMQQGSVEELEVSSTTDPEQSVSAGRLVIAVSSAVSHACADALTERGYQPRRFLSSATALTTLLREAGTPEARRGNSVLVHLGEAIGSAAFISDSALILGREFRIDALDEEPRHGEGGGEDGTPALERILEEIDRSLLLFNHVLSGRNVDRILLSSDQQPTETVRRQCEEKFGIPVAMLFDVVAIDTSGFGTDEIAQGRAAQWILPIAAAVADLCGSPELNLLPAAHLAKQKQRRACTWAVGIVLGVGLCMGGYHLSRVMTSRSLCKDLLKYQTTSTVIAAMTDALLDVQAARRQANAQLAFLAREQRPLRSLQHVLGLLSHSATDSLIVDRLDFGRVARGEDGLVLRLRGRVIGPTSAEAQAQFNVFWQQLQEDPALSRAELMPLSIRADRQSAGSILAFEIVGALTGDKETLSNAGP